MICPLIVRVLWWTVYWLLLMAGLIGVLFFAPYDSRSAGELWQPGDSVDLGVDSDLTQAVTVGPYSPTTNSSSSARNATTSFNRNFAVRYVDALPALLVAQRASRASFVLPRRKDLVAPLRLNAGSSLVVDWRTSQPVDFYIMTAAEFNYYVDSSAAASSYVIYTPTTAAQHTVSNSIVDTPATAGKLSQHGSAGTGVRYRADKNGLYYIVFHCHDCAQPASGTIAVNATLRQYNFSGSCAQHEPHYCCDGTGGRPCRVDLQRAGRKKAVVVTVPAALPPGSVVQINVGRQLRADFYFPLALLAAPAAYLLLGLLIYASCRCAASRHRRLLDAAYQPINDADATSFA